MVDFKKLKEMSGKKSLEELNEKLQLLENADEFGGNDDRFWEITVDKAGNGYAVIRFLPQHAEEDLPYVRLYSHGFEGPTGLWYIEKSRTTLGKSVKDPATDFNNILWKKSDDDESPERQQVRRQKRKLHYISNILVIADPAHPENEGKVFLYKYGAKIRSKIDDARKPPFDKRGRTPDHAEYNPENAYNPHDLWAGANFIIKAAKVKGYRNYDQSEFEKPEALYEGDDAQLEEIYNSLYPLKPLVDPSVFKPYDVLKARFDEVMGLSETPAKIIKKAEEEDAPWVKEDSPKKPAEKEMMKIPEASEESDNDEKEFFAKLNKNKKK